MTRSRTPWFLALVIAAVLSFDPWHAQAADWRDWSWREAPAYTVTVPAYGGVRAIPRNVCPFGISDLAATRGTRELPAPRVDTLAFIPGHAGIVNGYHKTLRAWVWCG